MISGSDVVKLWLNKIFFTRYSFDGKHYASGSRDGSIKLWDGISNKCIATIADAHEGAVVGSVTFSRSGKVSINYKPIPNRLKLYYTECRHICFMFLYVINNSLWT